MPDHIWIASRANDSPAVARLAAHMHEDRTLSFGALIFLWSWLKEHGHGCRVHAPCDCGATNNNVKAIGSHAEGCQQRGVIKAINDLIGHPGFVSSLFACDLIDIDAGGLTLTNCERLVRFSEPDGQPS